MRNEQLFLKLVNIQEEGRKGNLDESEKLAKELLAVIESLNEEEAANNWEIKFGTIMQLANIGRRRGEWEKALVHGFEILDMAAQREHRLNEAKALITIGNIYRFMSDLPRSLEYLHKALALCEQHGIDEHIADIYSNIGDTYSLLTEFPVALEYMKRSVAMKEEMGDRHSAAFTMGNIGSTYNNMSDYGQALEYLNRALVIHEEFDAKGEQADVLSNIGISYYYLHDHPRALEYMGRGESLYEQLGMKVNTANIKANIANIYFSLEEYDTALGYMNQALSVLKESHAHHHSANVLGAIGYVYRQLGEQQQALKYLNESLDLYRELNMKINILGTEAKIGSVYSLMEFDSYDPVRAEELLVNSLSHLEELGVIGRNLDELKKLAELFENTSQWQKANHYNKKLAAIEKEVHSDEVKKQAEKFAFDRKIAEEKAQRQATEALLHNILPKRIADRMMEKKTTISDYFDNVSIFFSDIVDFTSLSSKISPQQLVEGLNAIFSEFDRIAVKHGLEKIKTIGDSYMAVCGIPEPCENHAERVALFALEVTEAIKNFSFTEEKIPVTNRIGLHTGSVVAGVIGENKFAYDLWGDAVNTASRMESQGESGRIQVSEDFMRAIVEAVNRSEIEHKRVLKFTERGELEIKGKGKMKTYFLERN